MIAKRLSGIVPERVGDFKRWYLSRAEAGHQFCEARRGDLHSSSPLALHRGDPFLHRGQRSRQRWGREVAVKPGTMLVIPTATIHSAIREGTGPLRYLAIFVGNPDL